MYRQLAWIIILFGSIFGYRDQDPDGNPQIIWPTYCWFTLVFNFFLILGIFIVIASDSAQTYHVAVVGYLAVGLVGSTSSINNLIYSGVASMEATAAGYILLSMVTVCSPVHVYFPGQHANVCRSSGYSTLARRLPPFPALTSTPSRSPKSLLSPRTT